MGNSLPRPSRAQIEQISSRRVFGSADHPDCVSESRLKGRASMPRVWNRRPPMPVAFRQWSLRAAILEVVSVVMMCLFSFECPPQRGGERNDESLLFSPYVRYTDFVPLLHSCTKCNAY